MRRIAIITLCLLLTAVGLSAQQRVMLSRSALDSLVYPTISKEARGAIVGQPSKCDIGTIDDTERREIRLKIRNTTLHSVTITHLRSTCSCLAVRSDIESLAAGESGEVVCSFNPSGRSGEFSIDIFVYTDLDAERPTERLTVVGDVARTDSWAHLRYAAGDLRLSRTKVHFADNSEERIICANTSATPLRITARTTIEGLSLRTEPEVIAPQSEAKIVVSYRPERRATRPLSAILILEGIDCSPTERMITVTIDNK